MPSKSLPSARSSWPCTCRQPWSTGSSAWSFPLRSPRWRGDWTAMSPTEPSTEPAPDQSNMVLEARSLAKAFGSNTVLRDIDIDIRRGQVVALIGPSGSGKTTVLRSLNGLEIPDAGTVTFGSGDASSGLAINFGAKVGKKEVAALRD